MGSATRVRARVGVRVCIIHVPFVLWLESGSKERSVDRGRVFCRRGQRALSRHHLFLYSVARVWQVNTSGACRHRCAMTNVIVVMHNMRVSHIIRYRRRAPPGSIHKMIYRIERGTVPRTSPNYTSTLHTWCTSPHTRASEEKASYRPLPGAPHVHSDPPKCLRNETGRRPVRLRPCSRRSRVPVPLSPWQRLHLQFDNEPLVTPRLPSLLCLPSALRLALSLPSAPCIDRCPLRLTDSPPTRAATNANAILSKPPSVLRRAAERRGGAPLTRRVPPRASRRA